MENKKDKIREQKKMKRLELKNKLKDQKKNYKREYRRYL